MLVARITVLTEGEVADRLHRPPCVPEKTINIEVSFAGPVAQIEAWFCAHFDSFRPKGDRWRTFRDLVWTSLALLVAVAVIAYTLLETDSSSAVAKTLHSNVETPLSPLQSREGTSSKIDEIKPDQIFTFDLSKTQPVAVAYESYRLLTSASKETNKHSDAGHKNLPVSVRIGMIAAGPAMLVLFVLYLIFKVRRLCRVSIVVLKPHEPFPAYDRDISRERWHFVFAVRILGSDVYRTYFDCHRQKSPPQSEIHSLHVTHAGLISKFFHAPNNINPQSYWALIRYAVSLRLRGSRAEAYKITALLHQSLLGVYLLLLVGCLLPPALGWVSASSHQYPLLVAGLGVVWAVIASRIHTLKDQHLAEWERLTAEEPFRGCPIFYFQESDGDGNPDQWTPINPTHFETPIRDFGVHYAHVIHIIEGSLLALLVELLHIVH